MYGHCLRQPVHLLLIYRQIAAPGAAPVPCGATARAARLSCSPSKCRRCRRRCASDCTARSRCRSFSCGKSPSDVVDSGTNTIPRAEPLIITGHSIDHGPMSRSMRPRNKLQTPKTQKSRCHQIARVDARRRIPINGMATIAPKPRGLTASPAAVAEYPIWFDSRAAAA